MSEGGLGRRAGYGIKLCLRRLGSLEPEHKQVVEITDKRKSKKQLALGASADSAEVTQAAVPPKKAKDVDALVAEEILKAYSQGESIRCRYSRRVLALNPANLQAGQKSAIESLDTMR